MDDCEDNHPPLRYWDYQSDEKRISLRDRDRLRNDSQWVRGFLSCCSWMFPERLRNKSELMGSEEIRQVLTGHPRYETMSYWIPLRSFLVTLPSISSETWEVYSWAISGSTAFRDWLFLVFSGVSLETAVGFLLFLKVAMILREKFCQWWRLIWSFYFLI